MTEALFREWTSTEVEGHLLGHGREPTVLIQGQVDAESTALLSAVSACVFF
jgi:hypothetical protein